MHKVYIGLGANLGQRLLTLRSAFEAMKNIPSTFNCQISKVYESIPEHNAGPDFLNAVASAETELEPQRLLEYLLSLEHEFARRKHEDRSRELDLDLLDYDGEILEKQVRMAGPRPIEGLAEAASGPQFSTCAGLLDHALKTPNSSMGRTWRPQTTESGRFGRLGQWFRENF